MKLLSLFKVIEFKASDLKCDAPGCGHKESCGELTPEKIIETIDMPCPKCGASLLTPADARAVMLMRRVAFFVNFIGFPFMVLFLPVTLIRKMRGAKDQKQYQASMNGSGTVTIREKP